MNHEPRGEEASQYVRLAVDEIEAVIPPGAVFILVDDNAFPAGSFSNRPVLRFLERDGKCSGRPADDRAAVEQLHRLKRLGASHIVFAWTAFWWLDHHEGLSQYVRGHFQCLFQDDRILVFDLQRYAKEALLHARTPKGMEV